MNFDHKIVPLSSLENIRAGKNKKIILAGGCFDLLHFGHVSFIHNAKNAGDILVLLLESDDFIKKVKKKKPVHTQRQRAQILAALGYVDYVVMLPLLKNPDTDYGDIVKKIKPAIIAVTAGDPKELKKRTFAEQVNADMLVIPYLSSFSSSQLVTYAPIFRD